jgi:GAF domain-containing protein
VVSPDWVICGGESGPGARPFHLSWAESLLAQCRAVDVPFFMKQLGSNPGGLRVAGRGSAVCSILVLDKEGLLRNAASPNLPADYLAAIDRLKPNPGVGTCSAAAATGLVVVTRDFQADDKWAELRHLPLSLGFNGAWSMPIKTADGTVLGTLGTYFRERRSPTPEELKSVAVLTAAAGLVLARQDKST